MACGAVLRGPILPVTVQARAHIVFDQQLGGGRLGHVAVTPRAGNAGAGVRSVLELHQRFRRKAIHSPPGDLTLTRSEAGQLFDLGLSGRHFGVAEHAFVNRRKRRRGTRIGGTVAIEALQPKRDMLLMRIRNRLNRLCGDRLRDQEPGNPRYAPQKFPHQPESRRRRLAPATFTRVTSTGNQSNTWRGDPRLGPHASPSRFRRRKAPFAVLYFRAT